MKDSIRINQFNNKYDNLVKSLGDFTWEILCEFFSTHQSKLKKEEVPLFNVVRYRDDFEPDPTNENMGFLPNTRLPVPLRRKINLIQVDALVLDYDGGITIEDAKQRFAEYEYLAYTSYNHLKDGETHKFRMIFPLVAPIPINPRVGSLAIYEELATPLSAFAGQCDPVLYNPNQLYYIPATHPNRLDKASSWVNKGKILDWQEWEIPDREIVISESVPTKQLPGVNNKLDPNTEFVTQEGIIKANEVKKTYQKVRCPFHDDKKGSEFLKRFDDSGVVYFHCKRCGGFSLDPNSRDEKTPPLPANSITGDFIFDYFLDPSDIDRSKIQKELKKIASRIFRDRTQNRVTGDYSPPRAHIVYFPEGTGKSQLAVDIVREGYPVVFACQTWNQVYEKQQEFQEKLRSDDPDKHINVRISHSFESRFRQRWGFETLREGASSGYKTREINREATIARIMIEHPHLSRKYIDLWWTLFSQNTEKISQAMYKAMEDYEVMSVDYDNDVGFVLNEWLEPNKVTGMVITTFSQLRLLRARGDFIPKQWLIWFDDPGLDDVANISPLDEQSDLLGFSDDEKVNGLPNPFKLKRSGSKIGLNEYKKILEKSHDYSPEDVDEIVEQLNDHEQVATQAKPNRSLKIQGVSYHVRPEYLSLGYSTLKHRLVFTTTELLTKQALTRHLCSLWKPPVLHELMENVPYGRITILGTNKVRRRHDAIIPLIIRSLEKKNIPLQLIADGLGSDYNHVNSKGVNILTDTDILVEVSIPHPAEVRKVCAILGLEYQTNQREITLNLMLDKIHQAIGRNSGYRWKGKECIVLVDKSYHAEIIKTIRYKIDPANSVVIDRTRKMTLKEKRITPTATLLTKTIEEHLNHVDQIIGDRRSITHAIDHVIKNIEDGEKRVQYIARLLTALATYSNTRLENPEDSLKPEPHQVTNYRSAWNHIQTKWINGSNRAKVMTYCQSNMKEPD